MHNFVSGARRCDFCLKSKLIRLEVDGGTPICDGKRSDQIGLPVLTVMAKYHSFGNAGFKLILFIRLKLVGLPPVRQIGNTGLINTASVIPDFRFIQLGLHLDLQLPRFASVVEYVQKMLKKSAKTISKAVK